MRVGRWKKQLRALALAGFCMPALLAPHPAAAHLRHHYRHRYLAPQDMPQPAAPATDLGPTAPGVSAIVINAASGGVVSENGADIPRYPASLTKLMTLDLAFQALRDGRLTLDTVLPVSLHAATVEPVKLGMDPGDSLTVRQAILAMTTMSANDAATALGEYLGGGSEYRCAQMMTLRAHALGMAQTQFYNASGLPNPGQVTTARDLSILARDIVVGFPQFQPFFETLKFDFNGRTIYSNDGMLKLYPGAMGMKTGYTILARHNLITAAERDGTILIGVTLHENSWGASYTQMTAMLDNGFGGHIGSDDGVLLASRDSAQAPPRPGYPQRMLAGNQPNPAIDSAPAQDPPPNIPLPAASAGGSLFPAADAATLQPMGNPNSRPRSPSSIRLAGFTGWTAQLGSFAKMRSARQQALSLHHLRGVGIVRIARLDRGGKVRWAAQLAGLTRFDATATCQALAARGQTCRVIAPQADHLAMRDISAG